MSTKAQHIQLRKKVQLLAKQSLNNSQIAERLGVSRDFVIKWKKKKDVNVDKRGWQKGKKRKYTDEQEQLVIQKRLELEKKFFLELKRYCKTFMEQEFLKGLWKELSITTISPNLTARNKRVDRLICSTQKSGSPALAPSFKLILSVLVISWETVSLTIFSVVNMSDHLNFTSFSGSRLRLVQSC